MSKIKIRRLSQMPNKFNSYAYAIEDETQIPSDIQGIYETSNGKIIYSPVRLGDLNEAVNADFTVREKDSAKYINLVNPMADIAGQFGDIANLASKAGFANNAVLMQMFANQAIQAKSPAIQEGISA